MPGWWFRSRVRKSVFFAIPHAKSVVKLRSYGCNIWLCGDSSNWYSKLFTHCDEARLVRISFGKSVWKISFDTNRIIIPVIHCSDWFLMIVCLIEKIVISLDSFYKTKKANMFFFYQGFLSQALTIHRTAGEGRVFFIINGSSRNQQQRVNIIATKHFTTSDWWK